MEWPATELEAAEYLEQKLRTPHSPRTLQRYRREGRLAWVKVGKTPRYHQNDLDAFIESLYRPTRESA